MWIGIAWAVSRIPVPLLNIRKRAAQRNFACSVDVFMAGGGFGGIDVVHHFGWLPRLLYSASFLNRFKPRQASVGCCFSTSCCDSATCALLKKMVCSVQCAVSRISVPLGFPLAIENFCFSEEFEFREVCNLASFWQQCDVSLKWKTRWNKSFWRLPKNASNAKAAKRKVKHQGLSTWRRYSFSLRTGGKRGKRPLFFSHFRERDAMISDLRVDGVRWLQRKTMFFVVYDVICNLDPPTGVFLVVFMSSKASRKHLFEGAGIWWNLKISVIMGGIGGWGDDSPSVLICPKKWKKNL